MLRQSVLSTTDVVVPLAPFVQFPHDMSSDTISFAFVSPELAPMNADWHTGIVESETVLSETSYYGKILVGPTSTLVLDVGLYVIWIKLLDGDQTIITPVDTIIID